MQQTWTILPHDGPNHLGLWCDAWVQSEFEAPAISGSYLARMDYTYKRAASAMLTTSFTTAVAFLATASSPVMPISAFGIFASIAIVLNYVLVMSVFPALVYIWETTGRRSCCCCNLFGCFGATSCCGRRQGRRAAGGGVALEAAEKQPLSVTQPKPVAVAAGEAAEPGEQAAAAAPHHEVAVSDLRGIEQAFVQVSPCSKHGQSCRMMALITSDRVVLHPADALAVEAAADGPSRGVCGLLGRLRPAGASQRGGGCSGSSLLSGRFNMD